MALKSEDVAVLPYETSVHIRTTRRYFPEDGNINHVSGPELKRLKEII
jgi:hypothetical protein